MRSLVAGSQEQFSLSPADVDATGVGPPTKSIAAREPVHWDQEAADAGSFNRSNTSPTVASSNAVFPSMFCTRPQHSLSTHGERGVGTNAIYIFPRDSDTAQYHI